MAEEIVLGALDVERAWRNIVEITERFPSRLAGSANSAGAAEYIAAELRAAGVEAEILRFPGLVSFPGKASVTVRGAGAGGADWAIEANALGHSPPTDGIEGELVWVGSGGEEDIAGLDLRGKITLSELSYLPPRQEKQRLHARAGAIGCVMLNWGHDANEAIPFGSVKPCWGNPTPDNIETEMPRIPCAGIARVAGLKLAEMCRTGTVRVHMTVDNLDEWRECVEVIGRLPGADPDGEWAMVGGHMDSWFGPQATDNAAGNACTLELARIFAANRGLLRRGIVFGFWVGHETGTMIGSSYFNDNAWDWLREHVVAYLQIDQPGMVGTSEWEASSNIELRRFHQAIERRVLPDTPAHWRRISRTGDTSFFGLGIPTIAAEAAFTEAEVLATARASLGWWHHSVHNTIDKLDKAILASSLRLYAAYMWELVSAPVLPFDFVALATSFRDRLTELRDSHPTTIDLDGPISRAGALIEAAGRLDAAGAAWASYPGGEGEAARRAINACQMRLSRRLGPLASTAIGPYGHDPYGLSAQRFMVPSLVGLRELAPLTPGSPEWAMLRTKLVRDRNRVSDALADARLDVEQTLAALA